MGALPSMEAAKRSNGRWKCGGLTSAVRSIVWRIPDEIDGSLASRLGQAIATAHEAAPIVPAGPWIDALALFVEQNDKELREASELFPPEETAALHAACRAALERLHPLFVARGHLGLIRRGHGDLHLGNIVMLGDRPVLFDAIEFDPVIAAGDVLYDLAFLLMDLVVRGQHAERQYRPEPIPCRDRTR